MLVAIKVSESSPGVRKPDAFGQILQIAKRNAKTVVTDVDLKMPVAASGVNIDPAATRAWRDAV